MPAEKWRTARDLVSALGAGGSQVEFFQLVQLIERIRCQRRLLPPGQVPSRPSGTTARLAEEAIRFRAVIAAEFPALTIVGPYEGHDASGETEGLATELLARHPRLVGLYNLGAGNAGLLAALEASGRAGTLRVVAHEITGATRAGLHSGAIDVVLDQNPDREIRAAVAAARALAQHRGGALDHGRIEIGIFLRDNLR